MKSPFGIVRDFEAALCEYTGAKYAVTTNSCTAALLLSLIWCKENTKSSTKINAVNIPRRTYISVPMCIRHAGFAYVHFRDEGWLGAYRLEPFQLWDSARYFTSGMYIPGSIQCVSFHATKTLCDTQGGAILHDNDEADAWYRRMRFDGRTEGVDPLDDDFRELGYHCYLSPDVAARLLHKLSVLPKLNEPLPNSDYPDLSKLSIFK